MKIALASAQIVDGVIKHNLAQMQRYMKKAKANGAELVCFGEAFVQGFNALSWRYEVDKNRALTVSSQEFVQISAWTEDLGIDVLFGYNELADESIYSSCALISGGKVINNYRRISKGWKECSQTDEHYKEGCIVKAFEYKGKKCVIALCGDVWEYPERFALGEDILFWPVYVCRTKAEWEKEGRLQYAAQARLCCENTLYVNSLCRGDAIGGAVQFLDGKIKKELPVFHEGLLYVAV